MRVLALIVIVALIALLIYLRFGGGEGFTGAQKTKPQPDAALAVAIDAGPSRCAVRVTGAGLVLDGAPAERDAIVARCKELTGADVVVTGDARQGDWDELRAALEAAGVAIYAKQH